VLQKGLERSTGRSAYTVQAPSTEFSITSHPTVGSAPLKHLHLYRTRQDRLLLWTIIGWFLIRVSGNG